MLRIGRRPAIASLLTAGGTLSMALSPRPARAAEGRAGRLAEGPPKDLPAFTFTDAQGATRTLADFAGRGVVLNLWATWCPPCVAEMPALDRLHAAVEAEGIAVLPLSSDRGGEAQVRPFYAARGITRLGVWLDPRGAAGRALGARGLPTTVLVDAQGRERARLEGAAEWDAPEMVAAIQRLVGPEPSRAGRPTSA